MTKPPILVVTAILLIGLAGCAKPKYYAARPLKRLVTSNISPDSQEKYLSLTYRIFNTEDCFSYLDRNVIRAGYQPIYITIVNSTSRNIDFKSSGLSLPTACLKEVADSVKTSVRERFGSYASLMSQDTIIMEGIWSRQANKEMFADFERKKLRNQTINPYSMINGLVFVPVESFEDDFTLTLTDVATHEQFVLSTSNSRITLQ